MARGYSLTNKNIRKFVTHCYADEDLRSRAAIRGRELTTVSFLYIETDLTAKEICHMFQLQEETFNKWRKKNRWKKTNGARIAMSKERLEDLIIRGSHHLVPPKAESELDIRRKYNHIGYVCGLKIDEMMKSNIINTAELNNVRTMLNLADGSYKLQMNASGYMHSTKDIRELEVKHRSIDLKEKEIEMKNEGGKFVVEAIEAFDKPLGMSKGENLRIIHEVLQLFLENKEANKITEALTEEIGKFMTPMKEVEYVEKNTQEPTSDGGYVSKRGNGRRSK